MQDRAALVVDERPVHPSLVADMTEPVAQVDRSLLRGVDRPLAHLPHDRAEGLIAAMVLRVQRREILGETFAQPLFVIVAPADRLSPPLMRHFMGKKELGIPVERRRVVAPDQRRFGNG